MYVCHVRNICMMCCGQRRGHAGTQVRTCTVAGAGAGADADADAGRVCMGWKCILWRGGGSGVAILYCGCVDWQVGG